MGVTGVAGVKIFPDGKKTMKSNESDANRTVRDDRYQFQPWYIKSWRWRHFIGLPYRAVRLWLYNYPDYTFAQVWSIERGMVDYMMKHYHTMEEMKDAFRRFK